MHDSLSTPRNPGPSAARRHLGAWGLPWLALAIAHWNPATLTAQEEIPDLSEKFRAIERGLNPPKQPEQILAKYKGPDGGPWSNTIGMKFVPVPGTRVLFSIWETRVKDFRPFASATNLKQDGASLLTFKDNDAGRITASMKFDQNGSWTNPGFNQNDDHPVVCVNWAEACHFCEWLTDKERGEGKIDPEMRYRLPTYAEWKTAVGGGSYPWGEDAPPPNSGNYFGKEGPKHFPGSGWGYIDGYEDDWEKTAPVGSFPPNRFQLYDMGGNVRIWSSNPCSQGLDGSVKPNHVVMGSSWISRDHFTRVAFYEAVLSRLRCGDTGFRVVLAAEPHGPEEDAVMPPPENLPPIKPAEKPAPPTEKNEKSAADNAITPRGREPDKFAVFVETFDDHTVGAAQGIRFVPVPSGKAAEFSRSRESRVEYSISSGFPTQGTLEWRIFISNAYGYSNGRLDAARSEATIFTTTGPDTWYPGSAWFSASSDGTVTFSMADSVGGQTPQRTLSAKGTPFRFGEWHTLGISYGSQGRVISVDGHIVARDGLSLRMSVGGDPDHQAGAPTVGEYRSRFWANNQHENGFEGILSRFRASSKQMDWVLPH